MSEYDYLFKVIVVGDGAVGKTAITIRFAEGRFEEHYKMTIGVDFAIKLIQVAGYKVKLQVWDTGGQERFSYIRPLYYKGAMAALAIFDLTNRESYDNLPKWFQEVADNCGAIPLMLVGNKVDLPRSAGNLPILTEFFGEQFSIITCTTNDQQCLEKVKLEIIQLLDIVRIYSKRPGHEPEYDNPFVFPRGETLKEFAKAVHKDFAESLKFARVWGENKFEGQRITKDYILEDRDVIELHI